jgi:hypothetical protein
MDFSIINRRAGEIHTASTDGSQTQSTREELIP